jgi:phage major head subunit gpT-like protein
MSTRKLGKATINNLAALAMTAANYATLRAQMMQFKNASGKPLGLIPSHVMFGPSLESTAKKIFKAELVAEDGVAVSNTNAGEVERILNPYITDDSWYLMCLTRGINPVAVQQRKKGTLIRSDRDDSPSVISRNANEYLLHYRGAAAGAVPQLVIKSKAA